MSATPFPTSLWQSLHFEWLWVYHGLVPATETWSHEITVPAGWFWMESGLALIRAEGREILVQPGQSFVTAPGTRRQWFAKGTKLLSVGFRCEWPGGAPVFKEGLNVMLPQDQSAILHWVTATLFRTVHGPKEEVAYPEAIVSRPMTLKRWSLCEGAFMIWFQHYVGTLEKMGVTPQQPGTMDRGLSSLLKKLEAWPLDQPLKLSQLTSAHRLSGRRLHDLLRDQLGMTAQAWLERRRLDHARQRLASEDTPLKEIAFALGFRHPPHFTAWFKRHTHMTPTAFRQAGGISGA